MFSSDWPSIFGAKPNAALNSLTTLFFKTDCLVLDVMTCSRAGYESGGGLAVTVNNKHLPV